MSRHARRGLWFGSRLERVPILFGNGEARSVSVVLRIERGKEKSCATLLKHEDGRKDCSKGYL